MKGFIPGIIVFVAWIVNSSLWVDALLVFGLFVITVSVFLQSFFVSIKHKIIRPFFLPIILVILNTICVYDTQKAYNNSFFYINKNFQSVYDCSCKSQCTMFEGDASWVQSNGKFIRQFNSIGSSSEVIFDPKNNLVRVNPLSVLTFRKVVHCDENRSHNLAIPIINTDRHNLKRE